MNRHYLQKIQIIYLQWTSFFFFFWEKAWPWSRSDPKKISELWYEHRNPQQVSQTQQL